jgi:hypothetical protein
MRMKEIQMCIMVVEQEKYTNKYKQCKATLRECKPRQST